MNIIKQPELLSISVNYGNHWGGNQAWYKKLWQRKAGCGPTACANLIWYLSRTRAELSKLWPHLGDKKTDMLKLMEETWKYVTPTLMGVNRTAILAEGAIKFGRDRGISLSQSTLDIPPTPNSRPNFKDLETFLAEAFSQNLPVAFLNLDAGDLHNLESWHWVTLIAAEDDGQAVMVDQGYRTRINLKRWLQSNRGGGGFTYIQAGTP